MKKQVKRSGIVMLLLAVILIIMAGSCSLDFTGDSVNEANAPDAGTAKDYPPIYTLPHLYIGYTLTGGPYPMQIGTSYEFRVYPASNVRCAFVYNSYYIRGFYGGNDFLAFVPLRSGTAIITIYAIDKTTNEYVGYDQKFLLIC